MKQYLELEDQPVDPAAQQWADSVFRYLGMATIVVLLFFVLPWLLANVWR